MKRALPASSYPSARRIVGLAVCLLSAGTVGWAAAAAAAKQDFFHANVTSPVPGGFKLDVPRELGNRELAEWGLVDVTAAPFQADPTGRRDATQAIRDAVNFSRDHQMVCFFPGGTYRVSDTIECIQNPVRGSNGMFWPCVLLGSRQGARPKIVLSARSPGFDNPARPKRVIYFWARGAGREAPVTAEQSNILFNSMFVNIDVTVEKGNPGAVAVRMVGAQGSGVQECTIDVTHGHTGLEGASGTGGSHANVTVIGGRIGLDLTDSRPGATVTGITLEGQTETALVYRGIEAMCAVGLRIVSRTPGPAIVAGPRGQNALSGQLSLVDCQIDLQAPDAIAVASSSALYLNNVYVRGAAQIVRNADGSGLPGDPDTWVRVAEYGHGPELPPVKNYKVATPVYLRGARQDAGVARTERGVAPPDDLQSRHLWSGNFPGFESPGAVNVKAAPYGAKGDSFADDTDAIQRAVDEHPIVFLPKGYYRITRTIRLRPDSQLVGVAQTFSVLMVREAKGDFGSAGQPQPLVRTAEDRDARTVLAFCFLLVPREVVGAFGLHWRCGPQSILRSAGSVLRPLGGKVPEKLRRPPLTLVTGNGGGRWYNFYNHEMVGEGGYRHLVFDGAAGPLSIYQCNIEHVLDESAQIEIRRSRQVSIYGMKSEGNSPVLRASDSSDIRIFSYGGNLVPKPGAALFVFRRTTGIVLANIIPRLTLPGAGIDAFYKRDIGIGTPDTWSVVKEETPEGKEVATRPLDFPVLYRGTADGADNAGGTRD